MLSRITDGIVRQGATIVARIKHRNNQPTVHPTPNQQPSDGHQDKARNDPLSVGESLPALSKADKRSQNTKTEPGKEKRKPYSRYELSSTILTSIFAFLTAVYCVCEYSQWRTMQNQLTEMHTQTSRMDQAGKDQITAMNNQLQVMRDQAQAMKDQLSATTEATESAEKSHTFAQENARLDQRAWLVFTFFDGKPEMPLKLVAHMTDSGKTPATIIHISVYAEEANIGSAPNFDYDEIWSAGGSAAMIAPNANDGAEINSFYRDGQEITTVTQDDIDNWNQRTPKKVFLLAGKAIYEDVFHVRHWTTFCNIWRGDTMAFGAFSEHNSCDDNPEMPSP